MRLAILSTCVAALALAIAFGPSVEGASYDSKLCSGLNDVLEILESPPTTPTPAPSSSSGPDPLPPTPVPHLWSWPEVQHAKNTLLGFVTSLFETHYHHYMNQKSQQSVDLAIVEAQSAVHDLGSACTEVGSNAEKALTEVKMELESVNEANRKNLVKLNHEVDDQMRALDDVEKMADDVISTAERSSSKANHLLEAAQERAWHVGKQIEIIRDQIAHCQDEKEKTKLKAMETLFNHTSNTIMRFVADRKSDVDKVDRKVQSFEKLKLNREETLRQTEKLKEQSEAFVRAMDEAADKLRDLNENSQGQVKDNFDFDFKIFLELNDRFVEASSRMSDSFDALLQISDGDDSGSLGSVGASAGDASGAGAGAGVMAVSVSLIPGDSAQVFLPKASKGISETNGILTHVKDEVAALMQKSEAMEKKRLDGLKNITLSAEQKKKEMDGYNKAILLLQEVNKNLTREAHEYTEATERVAKAFADNTERIREHMKELELLRTILQTLEDTLEKLEGKLNDLEKLESKLRELIATLHSCKGSQEGMKELSKSFTEGDKLKNSINHAMKDFQKVNDDFHASTTKLDDLKTKTEEVMDNIEKVKAEASEGQAKVKESYARLQRERDALGANGNVATDLAMNDVKAQGDAFKNIAHNIQKLDTSGGAIVDEDLSAESDAAYFKARADRGGQKEGLILVVSGKELKVDSDRNLEQLHLFLARQFGKKLDEDYILATKISANGKPMDGCDQKGDADCKKHLFDFVKSGTLKRAPAKNQIQVQWPDGSSSQGLLMQ